MPVENATGAVELTDARWFAADLHVPRRSFGMVRLDEAVIERSSFLDNRIEASLATTIPVAAAEVAAAAPTSAPVGWLFHTSYCASTLLARALHLPPFCVALKEPLVLRRLSDARHAGSSIDDLIAPALALLARPWHPGDAVVIKPTHVALNLALDLLAAAPASRAILLTSSLPEFLISNLKKSPETQAKIPVLVERALQATTLRARLSPAALQPPDLLCAAGLQWAAQRELVHDILTAVGPSRARPLDMHQLLGDLPGAVAACARWLQLPIPDETVVSHARSVGTRNAKATATPYGPERRAQEAALVVREYRDALVHAHRWTQDHVLPAMRPAAHAPAIAA